MSVKMVTVKSMDGATGTYDSKGNYIKFVRTIANVTEEQAKELLIRPRNQYVAFNLKSGAMSARTSDPSMENLELEFTALFNIQQNLPRLRNWLREKMNITEPALLNFQTERSVPIVENQEAASQDSLSQANPVSPQNLQAGDSTGDDLDALPVDGIDDTDGAMSRANKALSASQQI